MMIWSRPYEVERRTGQHELLQLIAHVLLALVAHGHGKGFGAGLHEDLFQINEAHALVTEGFPIEL